MHQDGLIAALRLWGVIFCQHWICNNQMPCCQNLESEAHNACLCNSDPLTCDGDAQVAHTEKRLGLKYRSQPIWSYTSYIPYIIPWGIPSLEKDRDQIFRERDWTHYSLWVYLFKHLLEWVLHFQELQRAGPDCAEPGKARFLVDVPWPRSEIYWRLIPLPWSDQSLKLPDGGVALETPRWLAVIAGWIWDVNFASI